MSDKAHDALTSGSERQSNHRLQLSRTERFKNFLYNKETKKICGRTWQNWIFLWIYYIAAYCIFGALFVILIIADYRLRDRNAPQHHIYCFQPFLQEPGMNLLPKGDQKNYRTVINVLDSAENIAEINKFLSGYPKEATIRDCLKHDQPKNCILGTDVQTLGPCSPSADPDFGYSTLEPCIILTVNKIWGWKPKLYKNRPPSLDSNANFSSSNMPVTCETWSKLDDTTYKGHFHEASIYPPTGLNGNCFPYCGKNREHAQPFVMVKFKGLDINAKIAVVCVLHAENIKDSRQSLRKLSDNLGSVGFVLNTARKP